MNRLRKPLRGRHMPSISLAAAIPIVFLRASSDAMPFPAATKRSHIGVFSAGAESDCPNDLGRRWRGGDRLVAEHRCIGLFRWRLDNEKLFVGTGYVPMAQVISPSPHRA